MNIGFKMNCRFNLTKMKDINCIKCQLEFDNHYIKVIFYCPSLQVKNLILGLFNPLYHSNNNEIYYINYSLIESISSNIDLSIINFEILNPILNTIINFSISKCENNNFFKKKISKDTLSKIIVFTHKKIQYETKYLIEKFLYLLDLFKDCIDINIHPKEEIENILFDAYLSGRKFYEKYILLYNKNKKLKNQIDKELFEKLKAYEFLLNENEIIKKNLFCTNFDSLLSEFKIRTSYFIEESIKLFFNIISLENNVLNLQKINKSHITNNLMTIQNENQLKYNLQYTNSTLSDNNHIVSNSFFFPKLNNNSNLTINKRKKLDILSNLNLSKTNKSDIKINDSNIKFNLLLNKNIINNNLINPNKGESLSTDLTSKKEKEKKNKYLNAYLVGKELLETPKFQNNNEIKGYNSFSKKMKKNENSKISLKKITNQIHDLIKKHSLLPPTDIFNIFSNTAEIIYRKFFQICFKSYIGDIFYYEIDKDNLIKNDELYNYFMYLRHLKNLLFSDKNKIYFSSMILMEDIFS